MDLDQLKKINNLSHELQRHGFTDSSEESYNQAEQIIQIVPKQTTSIPAQETEVVQMTNTDVLEERQFQIQVEQLTKQFNKELDCFRDAINELVREVNTLKEEIHKLKAQPAQPKEKQVLLPTESQPEEPHPRQGNFKPSDVDIQKMFYFGNK